MLPAAHRLRSAAQFRAVTRGGSRASSRSVVAYVLPAASVEDARPATAGLIVGRSVGNSVVRHRTARRMRAGLAPIIGALPAGTTVVLRALPGAPSDRDLAGQVARVVAEAAARAASTSR